MAFYYSPKIVTDGLVLYLDAANPNSYVSGSTTWRDISRGGNNGTLINGPTYSSTNGGSIVFDGSNDYVTLGNVFNDVIAGSGKKFSTLCTFLPLSTSNQALFSKYSDAENGREFAVFVRDVGFGFKIDVIFSTNLNGFVNVVRSDTTLVINNLYNIVITYDDTQLTSLDKINIYVNGNISSKTQPNIGTFGPIVAGPAQFGLGAAIASTNQTSYRYNGRIYNFSLYSKLLSTSEVLQNYNATKSRFGLI